VGAVVNKQMLSGNACKQKEETSFFALARRESFFWDSAHTSVYTKGLFQGIFG
jgi:hypothetical protein